MVGPKLRWVRHELTLPKASPLFTLASFVAVDATVGRLTIDLPDLTAWPTPADKIELLLGKAAEVEHALMVQYLYSAYSMLSPSAVTDPAQKAALQAWPCVIRKIAREEMGHLMTVQNLRLFVGLPPSLARDNFPPDVPGLFPFDTHLQPITQRTLAEYVVAEAPTDATGIDDIIQQATGGGLIVNHVGVLYALIGVVLASSIDEIEQDATSGEFWDVMVRQIAYLAYEQNPPSSQWHLPSTAFVPSSLPRQGPPADWQKGQTNIEVVTMQTRPGAKQAIKKIGLQGEGPGDPTDTSSHFARFRSVYRGGGELPPFPATGDWVPTIDVPIDPVVSNDSSDPSAISNPATQPWANLANLRYAILLGFLEEYLSENPLAPRNFLHDGCFAEMTRHLKPLSNKLVTMPRATSSSGKAALPFTLPSYGFPLPDDPAARKQVHRQRLNEAIQLEQNLLGGGTDPLLSPMLSADQQSLLQFP
jgi:Ferritin-like